MSVTFLLYHAPMASNDTLWSRLKANCAELSGTLYPPVRWYSCTMTSRSPCGTGKAEKNAPWMTVNAAVAKGNRRRELSLIERAVEGARTPGGHGAIGLIDVQRSLNEGRVELLLFDADAQNSELADLEDEIVERAIRTSAMITPVELEAAELLREHGGVAAVLRY